MPKEKAGIKRAQRNLDTSEINDAEVKRTKTVQTRSKSGRFVVTQQIAKQFKSPRNIRNVNKTKSKTTEKQFQTKVTDNLCSEPLNSGSKGAIKSKVVRSSNAEIATQLANESQRIQDNTQYDNIVGDGFNVSVDMPVPEYDSDIDLDQDDMEVESVDGNQDPSNDNSAGQDIRNVLATTVTRLLHNLMTTQLQLVLLQTNWHGIQL